MFKNKSKEAVEPQGTQISVQEMLAVIGYKEMELSLVKGQLQQALQRIAELEGQKPGKGK